jgi:hypothetical protein
MGSHYKLEVSDGAQCNVYQRVLPLLWSYFGAKLMAISLVLVSRRITQANHFILAQWDKSLHF